MKFRSISAVHREPDVCCLQFPQEDRESPREIGKQLAVAKEECWTSTLRERYGLPEFTESEGIYADFTIDDHEVSEAITNWLVDEGYAVAERFCEQSVTYHFEVKSTVGSLKEPFMMSNNQFRLVSTPQSCLERSCMLMEFPPTQAQARHRSPSNVYIILRVYNVLSSPGIALYIDPFELMRVGGLKFSARGGYSVEPL